MFKPRDYNISSVDTAIVTIAGEWAVREMNTETGKISLLPAKYKDGDTVIKWIGGACTSLLLELTAGRGEEGEISEETYSKEEFLSGEARFSLEEPNVS